MVGTFGMRFCFSVVTLEVGRIIFADARTFWMMGIVWRVGTIVGGLLRARERVGGVY